MYVYYFVHLDDEPKTWVGRLDDQMLHLFAAKSLRDVRPDAKRGDLLSVLEVRAVGSGYSIRISWEAPDLFVELNGELSVQLVRPGLTQLALRGSYTPAGRADGWGTHRQVEAVVKGFLDSVAASA